VIRITAVGALLSAFLGWVWLALASAVYCIGSGRPALLTFPFWQWMEVAPYWQATPSTTFWFVTAPILPTVAVLAIGLLALRSFRRRGQPVYGESGWANREQMDRGGISTSRKLP
jgi:hypothetical protein